MADKAPILSVVIPTLGRPSLLKTVESLIAAKGFENIEVIIAGCVKEESILKEVQSLRARYPQIRHLPVSFAHGDSSEKKNAGIGESRAELVAFLDDDVIVAPDWPLRIIEPFAQAEVGLVSGPGLVPDDTPLAARLAGVALASKAAGYVSERYLTGKLQPRIAKWSRLIGCNMAYRKSVIGEIGTFRTDFWPGEEMLAAFKATQSGHKLIFHPAAYVYHYPRQTFSRFCRQIYNYGATRVRLLRAGVEFEPMTIMPALLVLSLLVLVPAAFFCSIARWILLLGGILYLLMDLWVSVAKYRETRRPTDLLIFFWIPCMHLAYGIAEWIEFLRPGRDFSGKGI